MIDLAQNTEPKVCCRNYLAMVDYISKYGDSADIARLFTGILGPNLQPSPWYAVDGEPLTYQYLTNNRHWLPNSLNLQIFSNLGQLPYSAFEVGRHTVKNMPAQSNHVMAAFLHLLGPEHSVRLVDRLNRQFNQTKQVVLSDFSRSGGCIELRYLPGIVHNEVITQQNLGCYVGTLELFGYHKVQGGIEQDHQADGERGGLTRLSFCFQGENAWQRLRWLGGYLVAGVLCRRYLQSHHVFHRYHREVIDAFQAELTLKEQYYQALMQEKNQRTSELEQQVAERTAKLTDEISNRQRLVQQIGVELQVPLTLMQQQLQQLKQQDSQSDACTSDKISRKLNRAFGQLHDLLQKLPDMSFQQDLIERPEPDKASQQDLLFEDKLQQLLAQKYADPELSVGQLAARLNCTERTLHRKGQQSFGKSPSTLLRDYRVHQAKLLLHNDHSVKDSAHRTGFRSVSYFTASFKKATGVTPSDYLKTSAV